MPTKDATKDYEDLKEEANRDIVSQDIERSDNAIRSVRQELHEIVEELSRHGFHKRNK